MNLRLILCTAIWLGFAEAGRGDSIDEFLASEMQRQQIPGLSVAVIRDGKVVKEKGYGLASVELSVPASEDTLYEIGSVTKPFTAAAVLLLVEDDQVRLDDPLGQYVEGVPDAWKRITIRQLLSHTSGLPRDPFRINAKTERQEYTRQDILDLVSGMSLLSEPGERFEYSNLGYYLLGAVIEEASGMRYGDFLDARIFKPLGMQTARINDYGVVMPNRARGYEWQGELRPGAYQSPSSYAPAGGIICSVLDMVKWDQAVSRPSFLKQSSRDQIYRPTSLAGGRTSAYGMGWNLDYLRGRRDYNHRGSNAGFSATHHRYVEDSLSVIVLANLARADLELIARGVASCMVPEFRPLSLMEVRSDPHPSWSDRLREGLFPCREAKSTPHFRPNSLRSSDGPIASQRWPPASKA